ncbi:MAG: histidinol-phosphatase [Myxococcaceae bacterium]|nr:histidinol-phosphatase [Myxococcaceae bacterium]
MHETSEGLMDAAAEVAQLAGGVALEHFRRRLVVETKRDGSPVTDADRAAERAARDWLTRRFPQDGILGEELGEERPEAPRRWVLDPIDGTRTFVRGVPLWGTLVGLVEGERVLCGAACFPAVGELLVAAPGKGCFWNGQRAQVSEVARVEDACVCITDDRFLQHPDRGERWRGLARRAALSRTWGDCYGYLLVATGRAEVMADEVLSPWDAVALLPIITEAGGAFTDWAGNPSAFGGNGIATNGALAREVRGLLGVP